jgi:hypothetical protein
VNKGNAIASSATSLIIFQKGRQAACLTSEEKFEIRRKKKHKFLLWMMYFTIPLQQLHIR